MDSAMVEPFWPDQGTRSLVLIICVQTPKLIPS